MAIENVSAFEKLLREDDALRAKLEAANTAWDGDASDERAIFEAIIAPLASETGTPFTFEELAESSVVRDLDDDELEAVAGGVEHCVLIGSDIDNAVCDGVGYACSSFGLKVNRP